MQNLLYQSATVYSPSRILKGPSLKNYKNPLDGVCIA